MTRARLFRLWICFALILPAPAFAQPAYPPARRTPPAGPARGLNRWPQWAESGWSDLRYCGQANADRFISQEAERYWMNVDLYVGGTEHAVLHLLYARFWHKVLFDLGYLTTNEPFKRLVNQDIILGKDGRKMSKRGGNEIDPRDITEADE